MGSPSNILIIGASRGIGLGLVRQMLTSYPSATIWASSRDGSKPDTSSLPEKSAHRLRPVTINATDPSTFPTAASTISSKTTSLDIVIYNSGVFLGIGNVLEVGLSALKENVDVNLYGAYSAALEFTPFLLRSKYEKKKLVFTSSDFACFGLPIFEQHEKMFGVNFDPSALYNISKTALNRLGKELDGVLRPQGVPVLLVHPGLVKTDMNANGQITVEESAKGLVNVIGEYTAKDGSMWKSWENESLPW